MVTFGERLRTLRKAKNLTQEQLAEELRVSRAALARWEIQDTTPSSETMIEISRYFEVSVDYLLGMQEKRDVSTLLERARSAGYDAHPAGPMIRLPVYEEAAAGSPVLANEHPIRWYEVVYDWVRGDPENYFLVEVVGDSMLPRIVPGALVLIHRQPDIENGQVALLRLRETGDVTIKRIRYYDDTVELRPDNTIYPSRELPRSDVVIIGRAVKSIAEIP